MCLPPYQAAGCAAAFSILQSFLHLGWCVWGISLYHCKYNISNETFTYFWYITYFYRRNCTNVSYEFNPIPVRAELPTSNTTWTYDDYDDPPLQAISQYYSNFTGGFRLEPYWLDIDFPNETTPANSTRITLIAYSVVNCAWIITAVILIHGAAFRVRACCAITFYFPWIVVLLCILIFDAVAGAWYLVDVTKTYGLSHWFVFVGAKNQSILMDWEKRNPKLNSSFPSILMSLICVRFIVIYLVNLFLFFRIWRVALNEYYGARYYNDDISDSSESKPPNQGHLEQASVSNNNRPHNFQVTEVNATSASVRIRRWQMYYGTDDEEEEQTERRPPRRRTRQKSVTLNEGWQRDDFQYNQAAKGLQILPVIGGYEGDRSSSPSPLPGCSQTVCSSEYESNKLQVGICDQPKSPSSSSDYAEVYQTNQKQNQVFVSELRGQLPWSYFQDRAEILMPKARSVDDVMPPIPTPDYSLMVNRKSNIGTEALN